METQKLKPEKTIPEKTARRVILSLNSRIQPLLARAYLLQYGDSRAYHWRMNAKLVERVLKWKDFFPIVPKTILDVGAHQGAYTLDWVDLFKPDFCGMVEPIPELCDALEQLILPCRSQVFRCALGKNNGSAPFHILENLSSSSLMQVNPQAAAAFQRPMVETRTIEVQIRTLDELFEECAIESLDLLKLDVQGYELDVLEGGTEALKRTRMVLTEMSFFEHYYGQPLAEAIIGYLMRAGFYLYHICDFQVSPEGVPLQCNALFIRPLNSMKES